MQLQGRPAALFTALLAALLLAFSVVGAPPASAHAQLVRSTPADGATLATMPERVEFEFNEEINPSFAQIVVVSPDSTTQAIDAVTVEGPKVSAALPDMPDGTVSARYRVVSADGHPIAGQVTFTVGDAATAAPAPSAPAADGAQSGAAVPNADEAADIEAAASSSQAPNLGPYVLSGLAAVLMVAFGVFMLRSERRKR
ncbi:MAG: copper resistance protein CopC [Dermatophilus congolensis]|nr:copper resistance protein CopC [Dermatophilus congolensis]